MKVSHPRHSGCSSSQGSTAYSALSPEPMQAGLSCSPNGAWRQRQPALHLKRERPPSPLVPTQLPPTARTRLLPNLVPSMLLRSYQHTIGQFQLTCSRVRSGHPECCRRQTATLVVTVDRGLLSTLESAQSSSQGLGAPARPRSLGFSVLHPTPWKGGGGSRMATTKALWAQEAHLQPSEVPRVVPPRQNEQRSLKDIPHLPQTHTPAPTHTHTHTLSWAVFTGPNSREEGKGSAWATVLGWMLQLDAEEESIGAQPEGPTRARTPTQLRLGLQEKLLWEKMPSPLLLLS